MADRNGRRGDRAPGAAHRGLAHRAPATEAKQAPARRTPAVRDAPDRPLRRFPQDPGRRGRSADRAQPSPYRRRPRGRPRQSRRVHRPEPDPYHALLDEGRGGSRATDVRGRGVPVDHPSPPRGSRRLLLPCPRIARRGRDRPLHHPRVRDEIGGTRALHHRRRRRWSARGQHAAGRAGMAGGAGAALAPVGRDVRHRPHEPPCRDRARGKREPVPTDGRRGSGHDLVGWAGSFRGYIGSVIDITEMKAAHQALVDSVALRSTILGSLYGEVVALSRDGVVIAVNEAWNRFAQDNGGDPVIVGVGANYLEVCRRAAASGDPEAPKALEALESVLEGRTQRALLEYACHSPSRARWFAMTVEPFKRPEGGLVISHLDITRRRRAEAELEHEREELTHALRVTTLGELAASLAHEINQPLAAIVSNAHATRRLMESATLDRGEILLGLHDIADDAKRASEVVRHLRALFRKEHVDQQPLDLNDVIREITRLLGKDLERKRISLRLRLADDLPRVLGDVVQLQQVILNVVVNACEAMADDDLRDVSIETTRLDPGALEITVEDTGRGVEESDPERDG